MTQRLALTRITAVASLVAATVHFAVSGEHFQEYWAFGAFMLGAAWLQVAWSVVVLRRPRRAVLLAGATVNAGIVAVYLVTRTVGDVVGPTPHEVEPIGFGDAFCTGCEVFVAVACVLLVILPFARPVTRRLSTQLLTSTVAVFVVLLSVALVHGGPEMTMSMDDDVDADGTALSLPTDTPAGPITLPDPTMQMGSGMAMADSTSCTATPTTAQQAAAVKLVDTSWADAKKYQSLAAAKTAGYRPLTPTGKQVVHYLNPAYTRATLAGGPVLNPSAPQSLVYANTPSGAVLVASMYIEPTRVGTPPDPGGCLTQWHVHTNLCFNRKAGSAGIVGAAAPTCPAGSVNHKTPPMLHVWYVPIPGGPTAVDAADAQIVHAAEQVPSPHNGTA